jgi:hypothetical protein
MLFAQHVGFKLLSSTQVRMPSRGQLSQSSHQELALTLVLSPSNAVRSRLSSLNSEEENVIVMVVYIVPAHKVDAGFDIFLPLTAVP